MVLTVSHECSRWTMGSAGDGVSGGPWAPHHDS